MTAGTRRGFIAAGAALAGGAAWARPLRANETAVLLPSLAHDAPGGQVALRLHAWVHEVERKHLTQRVLAKLLGLDWDALAPAERALLAERTRLFGTDAKPGRRLTLALPGGSADLPATDTEGHLRTRLLLPAALVQGGEIPLTLASGGRQFSGPARHVAPQGLSVVSDIDDTIKHTQVRQRRQMLRNTFARPFEPVPGMAAWYQRIVQQAGAAEPAFHYVSGAPVQLLAPLQAFVQAQGFPAGSLHLRPFQLSRAPQLLHPQGTTRHKLAEIGQLIEDFPQRRFVLVGDSGERDPEIYGELARRHPAQVVAVLVRDITGEPTADPRWAEAFAGVEPARWRLFTDPATLPAAWP